MRLRLGLPGGIAFVLLLASAAFPWTSAAQDAEPPPAEGAPTSTPPRLTEFVEATRPAGHELDEGEVLLAIVVAADGTVESVEVVESGGAELDEAAMAAARQFVFEPAMREGIAARARIRYRYVFEVVEEFVPPPVLPLPSTGEGGVRADEPPPAPESESESEPTDDGVATYSATGVVEPTPRDAGSTTLTSDVLRRIPGTRGDALRAVELLPGVGRPAFGAGVLIVRGAAPGDSQVFLDGNPVPLLYHFGGLTSFFNSQLLQSITFVPGNFSVRYGRKIGGILEVEPRDPRTDGYHGFLEISVIDASLSLEGPIGDNFAFAVALRRSLIDLVLGAVAERANLQFLTAPVYYDYQAIATWRPDDENRFRLLVYGATDQLRLLRSNDASDDQSSTSGSFGFEQQFHRFQLSWRHLYGDDVQQDISVGFGLNITQFGFGNLVRFDGQFWPVQIRGEWRADLTEDVHLIAGLDLQISPLTIAYAGPAPGQSEGTPGGMGFGGDRGNNRWDGTIVQPALYVESDVTIADMLDLAIGVRGDYFGTIERASADPRLSGRLRLSPQWAIRAGVGIFSQPPEYTETAPGLGTPGLGVIHAVHVGLGVDFRVPEYHLVFQVDGFYKHIQDRVVASTTGQGPRFLNEGLGRIYGLEVAARIEPGGPLPLFGFLSYTLMRSERQDHPGDDWRLFDFDQTHIFTLALVWEIGLGFELGATFRLVSGNPYTPVVGAVNDLSAGVYRPIYGSTNSARNPLFNRLDVRLQKRFDIGDVRLYLYVDVQNVYNATNREGLAYNYDFTQSIDISGLPIIPSLGVRGEL